MIIKTGPNTYKLMSKDGTRHLGTGSLEEMQKREKQVQMFKNLHKYISDHGTTKGFLKK